MHDMQYYKIKHATLLNKNISGPSLHRICNVSPYDILFIHFLKDERWGKGQIALRSILSSHLLLHYHKGLSNGCGKQ